MPARRPNIDLIFHALGEPTRRLMMERLSKGPASVTLIAAPLGITLAAVMQHLQILEDSGLVRSSKEGRVRTCTIRPEGLDAIEGWIAERRSLWENRLDRLGEMLKDDEAP